MKILPTLGLVGSLACGLLLSNAQAQTVFNDDFESGLGKWISNVSGEIVPGNGGHVLTFGRTIGGGDIWSEYIDIPAGAMLSFDYMGVGGFIGVTENGYMAVGNWLAGQGYGAPNTLAYDTTWRHYDIPIPFSGPSGQVVVEDYSGQPFSADFDNINVSTPGVPDGGSTLGLLTLACAGLRWAGRQRRN